jgi:uncharacterized protein
MDLVFGLGGVLLIVHVYLYWRLVVCTASDHRWRVGGAGVLTVLYLALFASLALQRWGPWQHVTAVHAVGMTWLAVVIYLELLLLTVEVVRVMVLAVRRVRSRSSDDRRQRRFARGAAILAGLVAFSVVGYGLTQAFGPIRTMQATIVLPQLPAQFEGYRIALATDLHLGPLSGQARTQEVVDLINDEDVDLVALVGDLTDGLPSNLIDATAPLADLTAQDGIFFTTGNHEYYFDAAAWREALPDLQITLLNNASHSVERGKSRLLFAGINDYTGEEFGDSADLNQALSDREAGDTVILLAHQPRQVDAAADAEVDLQLSGHTHGGQFWPFHLPTQAQQGTLAGWSKHGDTQLWTSRGAGFWGPPIRVGAPPDVSILTLTRG